ncbi:hypothetical protein M405DRAFT_303920 [Rhizopogon salebrosus TDB-379]|nr:hypothetical protein M405DRAFT_303920 [Rhizopogon salebrosus TDB-379]
MHWHGCYEGSNNGEEGEISLRCSCTYTHLFMSIMRWALSTFFYSRPALITQVAIIFFPLATILINSETSYVLCHQLQHQYKNIDMTHCRDVLPLESEDCQLFTARRAHANLSVRREVS